MPLILVDRRKAGKGKSSPNRQKLIKRIKSFIKSSVPQNIGQGGVSGQNAKNASPVKVAGAALEEPWFAYSRDGEHTAVIIGNNEYDRGDEIEIPQEDGSSNSGGPGDSGEDDFIVNIARDEFLDLFFEDCELPNLVNEKYTEKLDNTSQPAGFSTTGSPAQLSIIRTYKTSLGRRKAMSGPHTREKEELLAELEIINSILESNPLNASANARWNYINERLDEISKKLAFLRGFDTSDLRYRKKEAKPLKTVDAVLIMVMDISGSMDENKKTIARRWFALLYAFIKRRYGSTELVFIAHTDEPFEMSEDDFFSTRINGGTTVSPALEMINTIIKERYDPNETNIYVSHASDGDNWDSDNNNVVDEMVGDGNLMSKIQLFSYVEVGKGSSWFSTATGGSSTDTGLWSAYDESRNRLNNLNKMTLAIIETADECYQVFKSVFRKARS